MTIPPMLRINIVAALAIVGLIAMVESESFERAHGTEVVLSMASVDPRSLLSGDYAAINLQEPLAIGQACPPGIAGLPASGKPAERWIALAKSGDHFVAVGAAADRAGAARIAPLVVHGRPSCNAPAPPAGNFAGAAGWVSLDLGVDRFYADQREIQRITAIASACRLGAPCPVAAIVSIGQDGRARLKGLSINGQRVVLSVF